MKILILASNPRQDLNLDREIRDLKGVIEKTRHHNPFEVVTELAVRVGDLQDLMLRHRPQIVHFCGHGGGEAGLVCASDEVKEQWLQTEALSNLFRLCTQHFPVDCVLLNACYSEVQAEAMIEHINYVVGMQQTIQDNAAIAFAKGFYRALGYNLAVEAAYEFGCNAIQLEITGSSKVRSAATEAERKAEVVNAIQRTAIPEHLKPILMRKQHLIEVSTPALTEEKRATIQLEVAESLTECLAADQYRAKVREFLADRKISTLEAIRLERLRKDLGLSEPEAQQILEEEQAPIRKAQDEYEEMLLRLIEANLYPFSPEITEELQVHIRDLGLTQEEVNAIAQPILAAAEEDYQERLARERREQEAAAERERQQAEALKRQREEEQQRELERQRLAALALERQQQAQRQQELEQQRQEAERFRQEELQRQPKLISFEFEISSFETIVRTIEKPGFFGKKIETETTYQPRSRQGRGEYFVEDLGNGIQLKMVAIAAGRFTMGSPKNEPVRMDREGPQHQVNVSNFFIGMYPVTQAQWRVVAALPQVKLELNPDPLGFKGDSRPVEQVSWYEAVEFCDRMSVKTGRTYRLPSEAEWEYACRAGTTTRYYFGDDETRLDDYAWYRNNSGSQTHPVGGKKPNAWGLYDMHGNVWEWCQDGWHGNYQGAPQDGWTWLSGENDSSKIVRGGSWFIDPRHCRSACRNCYDAEDRFNGFGFRVVSEARGL